MMQDLEWSIIYVATEERNKVGYQRDHVVKTLNVTAWACENWTYLHILHVFRKWHFS